MFDYVKRMNEAFGNPEGDPADFDPMPGFGLVDVPGELHYNKTAWNRLQKQCENIGGRFDAVVELGGKLFGRGSIDGEVRELLQALHDRNINSVRDALCDIMVFALGAYHFIGYDANADMAAVLDGVMTRFCKDQDALDRTIAKWAALGVTDVYTQGQFPRLCVKSARDQTASNGDFCPKGKFLKSADYQDTVFPLAPVKNVPQLLGDLDFPAPVSPQRRRYDKGRA